MSRPSKPANVISLEKKSHRTKAEIAQRSEAEKSLETGVALKVWASVRSNPLANKEFLRLNKLLKNIEKNDALFEGVINRYCLLKAECEEFEEKREIYHNRANELADNMPEDTDMMTYYRTLATLQSQVIALDKQVMQKRKMMLDIEKENIMTIASALRSIPKKVDDNQEDDPMATLIGRRRA